MTVYRLLVLASYFLRSCFAPTVRFPPSQDNLLGAMQSWLEELV
ncbi:hypothetical protein [Planktothricoides raciborskii]|nr:hypothetical protein [Planktothricoides raciborskii]